MLHTRHKNTWEKDTRQAQEKAKVEVLSWLQRVKSSCNVQPTEDDYGKEQGELKQQSKHLKTGGGNRGEFWLLGEFSD